MGLYEARHESYRGWIFVCFSRDSMGLVEYLAEARDLLDMILDQDEGGSVILPGAHEYSMRANWKMLMENTVDIYHLNSTHSRFMRDYLPHVLGLKTPDPRTANDGALSPRGLGNGHAVIEYRKFSGVADEAKRKAWQATIRRRARQSHARLHAHARALSRTRSSSSSAASSAPPSRPRPTSPRSPAIR